MAGCHSDNARSTAIEEEWDAGSKGAKQKI